MKGVTVYFEKIDDDNLRLVLDDVESTSKTNKDWVFKSLYTSNSYKKDSVRELSLSKEQFAEIGENIVLRLLSLNESIK